MKKKIIINLLPILFLFNFCNSKKTLKNGDLTGYYGNEIFKIDTCLIWFNTDSTFVRIGDVYIAKEGNYSIKSDTLYVNFYCENNPNDNSKISICGQQTYILTDEYKLKIVEWKDALGEKVRMPDDYQGIMLIKK